MIVRTVIKEARKKYSKYRKSTLTEKKPFKKLCKNVKRSYGRNNSGKITVRHKARGSKRIYRIISFKSTIFDQVGIIKSVEYDPFRTSFISLVEYKDKIEYQLNTNDLKVGSEIICSKNKVEIKLGNRTTLSNIPLNQKICNIESLPGKGGKLARSAGNYGILFQKEPVYCTIKLRSKILIKVLADCLATIGEISNVIHKNRIMYKAGNNIHKGIRPTVRGVAMNPIDHPHGGGASRTHTKGDPVSYTNKLAKGKKTFKRRSNRSKFVLRYLKNKK